MSATPDSTLADSEQLIANLHRQLAECRAEQDEALGERDQLQRKLAERTAERDEALAQQTATAEVLQVINSSPGDLTPVFDAMLEKAMRLCGAVFSILGTYDGTRFQYPAHRGIPDSFAEYLKTAQPGPTGITRRLIAGAEFVEVADLMDETAYRSGEGLRRALVDLGGARSAIAVPLRKDDVLLGLITLYRQEVRPFRDKQIALLQNFAAQAVIAMENARLITELRDRTHDLQESLEYQTATSDVLKVISRSGAELEPVLQTLVETAARLCEADKAMIMRLQDGSYRMAVSFGYSPEFIDLMTQSRIPPNTNTVTGQTAQEQRVVHIHDTADNPGYRPEPLHAGEHRTALGVPLFRDETMVGVIFLARSHVEPFTEKQIGLVTTFADQAVIAIENARLFNELRERTEEVMRREAELRVTVDNMADGVVMFDGDTRLTAWNRNFQEILHLPDAFLAERPSYADCFRHLAERGEFGAIDVDAELRRYQENVGRQWSSERTRPDGRVIEVRNSPVPGGGLVLIYSDITERKRAEAEIRAARDAAERALQELKGAQASLLHAQKMAALGQLTAGIAHEIKNPLNFVNNFADLSVELLGELKDAVIADKREEVNETIELLTGNLDRIAEHGRRADGIVKSMLEHSRGSSGDRRSVDLNALVDEALNLAYHGARAQDQNFNITLEREFASGMPPIELVPQDVTRVFLNLIGNGFYAATKKAGTATDGFRPTLKVTTCDLGDAIEIRIRDNGVGIEPEHHDKLFQPFFTTKPTGEGTGLGLSISYDIVTQQHGGTIEVESSVNVFTEFTIRLPRSRGSARSANAA